MSAIILLSILGVVLLYMGLGNNKRLLAPVGILGLAGAGALSFLDRRPLPAWGHGAMAFDDLSVAFCVAMAGITLLLFVFGSDYYSRTQENVAEHYALLVFSLTGAFLLTSYQNLLMLFLGIEVLSIPLYILAGGKKRSYRSSEAGFKYFLLGSFATAFFLMGIALVYGMAGSFDLKVIGDYAAANAEHPAALFLVGMFFIAVGLGFKVAAVPFHFWSPDVYEGAPTIITAFMSTVVKMGSFAAVYRLIGVHITALPPAVERTLWAITILTLLIGNLVALRQSHFKRLMAYSSIAHTGFLLMAVLSGDALAGRALFYYTLTYALATVGLFVVFTVAKRAANGDEHIRIFRGMFKSKPWLAAATLIMLLSLAGIPPTAGFLAKYQVFVLAVQNGYVWSTLFAAVMAVLGIYYYLKVIRETFTTNEEGAVLQLNATNTAVIAVCGVGALLLGLWPMGLI
ncbi:MAG: NADH-quinone oxidoreductase subunit N [Flavobacteriales bacterium]|nr:NADH-quinone oxidoreductase subunit N [Flavobacteriales bacterium]MBK9196302.1 NADH-quinone oxidoreductase subunit N [Flavobacteriales bacterium]